MAVSAEDSQHVVECLPAFGMLQGVSLRCVMTVIRGLQDGQAGGVLADPAVVSLSSQPLADGFAARPARGNRTARSGKSGHGLRA
jgi:hypothetical protein